MNKKIIAFKGSPRINANSSIMLDNFLQGFDSDKTFVEIIDANDIDIAHCRGCLRCNLIKRCSKNNDEWITLSKKILDADILVFASPVYFHHLTAPLKAIIDRFRSFVSVQITETGLIHTPHNKWKKDFVLLHSMGSPDIVESKPVVELFEFITSILGSENKLHVINATRLAVPKQILKSEAELELLYDKLNIPKHLAKSDFIQNQQILNDCRELGKMCFNK